MEILSTPKNKTKITPFLESLTINEQKKAEKYIQKEISEEKSEEKYNLEEIKSDSDDSQYTDSGIEDITNEDEEEYFQMPLKKSFL